MLKLSLFFPPPRTPACLNFLCFCLVLGHQDAQPVLSWHGSTLPLSLSVPALRDQGDLRCIFSGTGAVPTVNVTLLSTKES